MFSSSKWPKQSYRSKRLPFDEVADRQERIPGFSTKALSQARILLIGAGGLGGQIAGGLTRKGVGRLVVCDPDVVELSNFPRQAFCEQDLFKPKAIRLAHNAASQGYLGSHVTGHYVAFNADSADTLAVNASLGICGVDTNLTRAFASRYFRDRQIPCIFTAVNENANYCWIFVQEPRAACVGCVFPRLGDAKAMRQPCRAVPAVLDVVQLAGSVVLYAVDSLLMDRARHWNFRDFHFAGGAPDVVVTAYPKPTCPLCGGGD